MDNKNWPMLGLGIFVGGALAHTFIYFFNLEFEQYEMAFIILCMFVSGHLGIRIPSKKQTRKDNERND